MSSLTLLHAERDALTVSWTATPGARRYVLQLRTDNDDSEAFTTLSATLQATQVRKKNLDHTAGGYVFRVGAVLSDDGEAQPVTWTTHTETFCLLTAEQEAHRMEAPTVAPGGSSHAALVHWKTTGSATDTTTGSGYELQMRENVGGAAWGTIVASFAATQVKKKNLVAATGYQFRVRAAATDDSSAFSPPSLPFVAWGVTAAIQQLFGSLDKGTLLQQTQAIPLVTALGGKEFILLYASAHWCGPCRQFTPQLAQWYHTNGGSNKTVEVVFLSADHDATGFRSYYASMPWLAIDFDEDTREELMSRIKVTGIPRLCVVDGKTGRILEANAVGQPLDVHRWRRLAVSGK
jgi:thiol-disulfide isomerase/thioredoxin